MTNNLVSPIVAGDEDVVDLIAVRAAGHWVCADWYLCRIQRETLRELSLVVILCPVSHLVTLYVVL